VALFVKRVRRGVRPRTGDAILSGDLNIGERRRQWDEVSEGKKSDV